MASARQVEGSRRFPSLHPSALRNMVTGMQNRLKKLVQINVVESLCESSVLSMDVVQRE